MSFVEIDPFGPAFVHVNDFRMIETKQTEDGGVQVVDVNLVFHRMQAEFVGFADDLSAFYASPRHPHGEPGRVVVATVPFFTHRGASEFSTPDDQRFVQEATGLEVGHQTDDGKVDLSAKLGMVALHLGMAIPFATGSMVKLNEANPAFNQPSGEEALLAEDLGILLIQPVKGLGRRRLLLKVDRFGGVHLHLGGQFITADAGLQFAVGFPTLEVPLVEALQERQLQVFGLLDLGGSGF